MADISPIPIIILGVALTLAAVVIIFSQKKTPGRTRYRSFKGNKYSSTQFSKQMELDMRLPYRRFKQLYPSNAWTYEEYKQMQTKTAYRRATSSEHNKRMVR